jgi:DNA-binding CsgD family transcriptional regulator
LLALVAALVKQQRWPDSLQSTPQDMHAHMDKVMAMFGSSTLTPRERDVVRLILRGYPSKSVARELNISTQTEQVHRKNIYQKLGISSHSELFTLFFDAIALPTMDGDPLLVLRA